MLSHKLRSHKGFCVLARQLSLLDHQRDRRAGLTATHLRHAQLGVGVAGFQQLHHPVLSG